MARYKIRIADPLLGMGLVWPEGCSLAEMLEPAGPGVHWHLFDDPGAPAGLEGREVDLVLAREDGKPVIRERRPIAAHLPPAEDDEDETLPCCGIPAWELPRNDSIADDRELATCGNLVSA